MNFEVPAKPNQSGMPCLGDPLALAQQHLPCPSLSLPSLLDTDGTISMKDQTTQGNIREIIFKNNFYFGLPFFFFFFNHHQNLFLHFICDFKVRFSFLPLFHDHIPV